MSLALVIDSLRTYLLGAIAPAPKLVGGAVPLLATQLPALTLSVSGVTEVRAGIGNVPRPPRKQPLEVTATIRADDPALHFPDGDVPLLFEGGEVVAMPHSPLVHADGAPIDSTMPLTDADLTLTRVTGAAEKLLKLVDDSPGPNEFAFDLAAALAIGHGEPASAGVFRLGNPLTTGSIRATYFIGEWEVTVARYRGDLRVDVFAGDAPAVDGLSAAVGDALALDRARALGQVYVMTPTGWGVVGDADPARANARSRSLTFHFDYEIEQPLIRTGGGRIAVVRVSPFPPPAPPDPLGQTFEIRKKQETP
jgi:hypothetical protein